MFMKAARLLKFGEVVIDEVGKPEIAEDKVLVEVHAAGVNPFDVKVRAGNIDVPLPITLGGDFSGIVVEIGANVSNFKIGDEVYGQASIFNKGSGSFAQYDLVNPSAMALKPKSISFIEAGAISLTGVSALQALTEHINLAKDQKILIHGGAGGIGTVAVQIAKHIGAYIATTVSPDDFEYVKNLGADEVIDYKNERFEEKISGFDAVFDTVGGDTYRRSFKVLRSGGTIVSMLEKPEESLMKEYNTTAIGQFTKVTTQRLEKLAGFIDQGIIKIHIDKTFPLDKSNEALTYLEKGHPKGKLVLLVKNNK